MRPNGTPHHLEWRRLEAIALLKSGLSVTKVAQRLGTTETSVFRWKRSHTEGGDTALCAQPVPGRPPKLDPQAHERLWDILFDGAMAHGFPNDLWTLKRIARVIQKEFHVSYHPSHVWKILRHAGWSCQVPERRAIQRDENAIAHWKRYQWPAIKKSPETERSPRFPR